MHLTIPSSAGSLLTSKEHFQDFVEVDVTRNSIEFEELDEVVRKNIEADSFWCMTKVLDGIQDNYTFAQPGIQVKIRQLEELLKRVDVKLHNHIVGHDVQYLQFSFRSEKRATE